MEPVGSELFVMLRDPQLRERVLNQPESRASMESRAARTNLRCRLAQALRALTSHNLQPKPPVKHVVPRQGAIAH
jgi:hypothetical protein